LKDDPTYQKYFKMLKVGLPIGAVKNALVRDGLTPDVMDLDPEKSLASQQKKKDEDATKEDDDTGPPLKDDPTYQKYFKMLKVGLPVGAVKNALVRDGLDPSVMDLNPDKSLASQMKKDGADGNAEEVDTGPPLKDDPTYQKYYKMLKIGLPVGAVKNAMTRDGMDPSIMDLDPDKSLKSQRSKSSAKAQKKDKKIKVRRKKLYWTPLDEKKLEKDSLWSIVRGSINMSQLKYDATEFESLFTDRLDQKKDKNKSPSKDGAAASAGPKKSVQVIDGKRGMNGGIILSRIKMEYADIATMVDLMESGKKFDATQLRALQEFLPTDEERQALKQYVAKASTSDETKAAAMNDLCACEQYMVAMMDVPNASNKFDCMLFRTLFESRLQEIMDEITKLNVACQEVRSSERLRKLMAIILTVGNQINTGGEGNSQAAGFSLDALLKLDEAKAFDKKTSVLFYLVKLIKENDEDLLKFTADITNVPEAQGLMIDSLFGDLKQMSSELGETQKTADEEADRLKDENGKFINYSRKKSLAELQAQKTSVHQKDGVDHFNMMESEDELTDMQFFAKRAKAIMDESFEAAEEMKSSYLNLLRYFGEDEKMPSGDFFATLNRFLGSFEAALDAVNKAEQARIKEEKRQKAQERKEKMRSTVQKGAAALQQATKKPPSLNDILKKRSGTADERNLSDFDNGHKPKATLAGAAAAALAKTKNKARDGMVQLHRGTSENGDGKDGGEEKAEVNPRVALLNSLRKKTATPTNAAKSEEEEITFDDSASSTSEASSRWGNVPPDPRLAMLAAIKQGSGGRINSKQKIDAADESTKTLSDPRAALVSAINNKGDVEAKKKRSSEKGKETDDPRHALLAAIQRKGDQAAAKVTNEKTTSPRAALLTAIKAKKESPNDKQSAKDGTGLVDARANLLLSIKTKTEASEDNFVAEENTASAHSRANLLAAIRSSKKSDTSEAPQLACIANKNLRSRRKGTDSTEDKSTASEYGEAQDAGASEDTDDRAAAKKESDRLTDDNLLTRGLVLSKSDAKLVLNNLDDEKGEEDTQDDRDSATDVTHAPALSGIVADRMAETDELLEQFDESLERLEIQEADLLKSYDALSDADDEDESCVGTDGSSGLGDLATELEQAEKAMLVANDIHAEDAAEKICDDVVQAAAEAALARRDANKDNEGSAVVPIADGRSALLVSIQTRSKNNDRTTTTTPTMPPVDPRKAMLTAIKRRKVDSTDEGAESMPKQEKSKGQPREALLSAIQSLRTDDDIDGSTNEKSRANIPVRPSESQPQDPRAAAARTTSRASVVASDEKDSVQLQTKMQDPRSALLAAIAARGGGGADDDSQEKNADELAPKAPQDPRSSLLAAIEARRGGRDASVAEEKNESPRVQQDAQSTLMRAIVMCSPGAEAGNDGDVDNTQNTKSKDEEKDAASIPKHSQLDPRSAMLAAIQSRKIEMEDTQKVETEEPIRTALDPRTALLSSIRGSDKALLDPRQAMLEAIQSRNVEPSKDNDDASGEKQAPPKPHLDARSAMLSAIQARKGDADDDSGPLETTAEASPLVADSKLLEAVQSRKEEADDENKNDSNDGDENDPRQSLLAAIRARNKD